MRFFVLGHTPSTAAAAAAAAAVLLAACSSAPPPPQAAADPSERRTAVTVTRELVVEPAQHLGTAAATVAARLDDVVEAPGEGTVAALRDAVADLEGAREQVGHLELDPTTQDVRAADAALDAAMGGARRMARAGTVVATAADHVSAADQTLDELVATWDEPGSYSELLARLDETALAADALAADEVGVPPEGCPGPIEDHVAAANFVADASRELRALVEARDGEAFDARRAELAATPFGHDETGTAREHKGAIDPQECPEVDVARQAATTVTRALQDLQAALNPADLSG